MNRINEYIVYILSSIAGLWLDCTMRHGRFRRTGTVLIKLWMVYRYLENWFWLDLKKTSFVFLGMQLHNSWLAIFPGISKPVFRVSSQNRFSKNLYTTIPVPYWLVYWISWESVQNVRNDAINMARTRLYSKEASADSLLCISWLYLSLSSNRVHCVHLPAFSL